MPENKNKPYLSVIIPSYKEGKRLGANLQEIEKYLKDKNFEYEVIVVVDGSPDNTAELARISLISQAVALSILTMLGT